MKNNSLFLLIQIWICRIYSSWRMVLCPLSSTGMYCQSSCHLISRLTSDFVYSVDARHQYERTLADLAIMIGMERVQYHNWLARFAIPAF